MITEWLALVVTGTVGLAGIYSTYKAATEGRKEHRVNIQRGERREVYARFLGRLSVHIDQIGDDTPFPFNRDELGQAKLKLVPSIYEVRMVCGEDVEKRLEQFLHELEYTAAADDQELFSARVLFLGDALHQLFEAMRAELQGSLDNVGQLPRIKQRLTRIAQLRKKDA